MSDSKERITIKTILNLPTEGKEGVGINYKFSIELSKNSHHIMISDDIKLESRNDFADQINANNIQINKKYQCHTLLVIDDTDKEYTIYNFSYRLIRSASKWYIQFCFNGILEGKHLNEELKKQKFDRMETEIGYDKKISISCTCGSIKSTIEPIMRKWLPLWDKSLSEDIFAHKLKIALVSKEARTFKEFEEILWRLSEFAFLCCEDMFSYNTLSVYIGGSSYTLKCYLRANYAKSRRSDLRTNGFHSKIFYGDIFTEDNFAKFLHFREDSRFIFDVFRTTVYSNTFREDYPLRLSQTLDGLSDYLGVNKNKEDKEKYTALAKESGGRPSSFMIAISSSLTTVKDVFYPFGKDFTQEDFCNKIKNHRHKFSHVKADGDYLQEAENEEFAEILYTTIRVLIIKRLKGEI